MEDSIVREISDQFIGLDKWLKYFSMCKFDVSERELTFFPWSKKITRLPQYPEHLCLYIPEKISEKPFNLLLLREILGMNESCLHLSLDIDVKEQILTALKYSDKSRWSMLLNIPLVKISDKDFLPETISRRNKLAEEYYEGTKGLDIVVMLMFYFLIHHCFPNLEPVKFWDDEDINEKMGVNRTEYYSSDGLSISTSIKEQKDYEHYDPTIGDYKSWYFGTIIIRDLPEGGEISKYAGPAIALKHPKK